MKRAYRYKLKPTMRQQRLLSQHFGCCRFIYNWGLSQKMEAWTKEKKSIGYLQLARELTLLKNDGEHDWLKDTAINIRNFGLHPQAQVAIENKIPEVIGINMDGEAMSLDTL